MAITYKGVHHRSPSGTHNKVRWILSKCDWDLNKVCSLDTEMQESGEKFKSHLVDAFYIAKIILNQCDCWTVPNFFFKKYHW